MPDNVGNIGGTSFVPDEQNNMTMDNQQMSDMNGQQMPMDDEQISDIGNMTDDVMGQEQQSGNQNPEKKEIQKNIGKGCQEFRNYDGTDKAELGKWISGMLDSLDGDDDENVDIQTESIILTKAQLNKINEETKKK